MEIKQEKDNFFAGKNVLITGINGFIGSHLASALLSCYANVFGIVKDVNSINTGILEKCTISIGDIRDYRFLCDIIAKNEIEIIYHFAASSIVRTAAVDPYNTYDINVMGTVTLLEAIRNVGKKVKSINIASSDKAYGDHDILPYIETYALQPKNTYDTSKACCDMIARSYANNYDMPISVSRCSNVYGPGDYNFSRLIPNSIKRILEGNNPVIYKDIENMTREFIYINDVVTAYFYSCLNHYGNKKLIGKAYNIGGTGAHTIKDVIDKICLLSNSDNKVDVISRENYFKEIEKQYISAEYLENVTGWKPIVSLDDGLESTIKWYKRLFNVKTDIAADKEK